MKRRVSAVALVAALISGLGSSAEAGLFFHRRVVSRPMIAPVYVAPVRSVMYAPSPVVYTGAPLVYPAAYYVPAPAYYVPSPVYVGW